ncbi:hypothetical protein TYRP_002138 [Tyrophagus putrescentiae]|nr:hypothetical protein TYRP_002138 [Tyrophagus putrescentiae]
MMMSSLMSCNDPFMSDHQSIMAVDPNDFLNDIGSVTKGTNESRADDEDHDSVCPFCSFLRCNELTDCLIDESQVFSADPALMEWVNMDDSLLENMILGGFGYPGSTPAVAASTSSSGNSVGTSLDITPSQSPDRDFDEFLSKLKFEPDEQFLSNEQTAFPFDAFEASNSNSAADLTPPLTPVHQATQDPLSTCLFESGIANFEEVNSSLQKQMLQSCLSDGCASGTASEWSQAPSPACTEVVADIAEVDSLSPYSEDSGDADSVHSFSSTASTLKRKAMGEEDDDDEEYLPPSKKANKGAQAAKRAPRKAPARRNRRVQDERVKNQNKVAAMKYRAKKRDEKSTMDVLYEAEEEKNKMLKVAAG